MDWLPPRGSGDSPVLEDEDDLQWISPLRKGLGAAQSNNTNEGKIRKLNSMRQKKNIILYVRAESLFHNILLRSECHVKHQRVLYYTYE